MASFDRFEDLPENIRSVICSIVASDSVRALFNLRSVSRTLRRLCNEPYALRQVPLVDLPLFPWWFQNAEMDSFLNFLRNCCDAGNVEALYRVGVHDFFTSHGEGEEVGLRRIAAAASNGMVDAQYVYGTILVCLGGPTKQQGLEVLRGLEKSVLDFRVVWGHQRTWLRGMDELMVMGVSMVNRMKSAYVREVCGCGLPMDGLLERPSTLSDRGWRIFQYSHLVSSLSCPLCTCHYIIQAFFYVTESCANVHVM